MHFHLPKPLHGWREFAGEVGIIVVGVLIALGAEQVVEELHWKTKAHGSRDAIFSELASDAGVLDERTMEGPCLTHNLRQVSAVLAHAFRAERIGDVEGIARAFSRPLTTAAWDAAVADGTVSHLPQSTRRSVARIYAVLMDYRRQLDQNIALRDRLRLIEGSAGRFPDALFVNEANAVGDLSYHEWLTTTYAEQNLPLIRSLGIRPAYDIILDRPGTRDEVAALHKDCPDVTVDGRPVTLAAGK